MSMADHSNERFFEADFSGSWFHGVNFSNVKISNAWLFNVDISGLVGNFSVNGVDVSAYVEAELNKRHPERLLLAPFDPDGMRAAWNAIEDFSAATLARARGHPPDQLDESVAEESSFVETLRHLVFITDAWFSRTVLDQERPYHPLGVAQSWYADKDAVALGIDLDAAPSYAEVLSLYADRAELVRRTLAGLTDGDLGRECVRTPAPGYPEEPRAVAECLAVLMDEAIEHYRFADRDLAVLEAR